jgi:hypothetical protein
MSFSKTLKSPFLCVHLFQVRKSSQVDFTVSADARPGSLAVVMVAGMQIFFCASAKNTAFSVTTKHYTFFQRARTLQINKRQTFGSLAIQVEMTMSGVMTGRHKLHNRYFDKYHHCLNLTLTGTNPAQMAPISDDRQAQTRSSEPHTTASPRPDAVHELPVTSAA